MTTVPPAGPPPPPSAPAAPPPHHPPAKRGWVKWLFIGCGLILLIIAGMIAAIWFGVTKATEGPEKVVREFLEAAAEGDAARAHETFSAPLRDVQSIEQLQAMMDQEPSLFATTDATFSNRKVDGSGVELSGTATLESGTEAPVSFRLVRENDEWKLISWEIGRDGPAVEPSAEPAETQSAQTGWLKNAGAFRGRNGERIEFQCVGPFTEASVWGTLVYTDDSSVCNAAVHAGLIDRSGGSVTIEIRPGQTTYTGLVAHGIESSDYGNWGGSFVFIGADGSPIEPPPVPGRLTSWSESAASLDGSPGDRFELTCPPNGDPRALWGSDIYTSDSSICTAAVHAGLIDLAEGGTVTLELRPGQDSYSGAERNGIRSSSYGSYRGSFTFVETDHQPGSGSG